MRIVFGILCLLMLMFVAVQYNDPDGILWMLIYMVPATCCALMAWRPNFFQQPGTAMVLLVFVLLGLAGMIFYWPQMPKWWEKSVWMDQETAREGMGVMIAFAVLVFVWLKSRTGMRQKLVMG